MVVVTGGTGMVGRFLKDIWKEPVYLSSKDYDLTTELGVVTMYADYQPNTVIHLAARVGGILDNINKPNEYFVDNIMMNTLLVDYARKFGVKNFIGILSTCIYPDTVKHYPMHEFDLHLGPPAETNFSYGYAKRAHAVHIDACNKQFGTDYCYLIPSNLYGEYDKWGDNSHFVAALIKKIIIAKREKRKYILLFGSGKPLRQFLYAGDLARIIKHMYFTEEYDSFNIASKENLSILEMTKIALKACDAEHLEIKFDKSKPDGQYRKDVSIGKFESLFGKFEYTSLYDGIRKTYNKVKDEI